MFEEYYSTRLCEGSSFGTLLRIFCDRVFGVRLRRVSAYL